MLCTSKYLKHNNPNYVGMTLLSNMLLGSTAETSFTEPDDALKCDARDALMFFGAAESLGFTSRANNFDARDIKRVENYFMSVGIQAKRLMQSAYMSHQQSVDQTSVGKANEFNDVNALEVKKCFSYLKCYENLLSPCSGHFVDIVTKSIQEAIGAATVDVLCFLTKLNSYAEESGGHSFAVLLVDFELCDMLSVLDEYLPSTDGNLKFTAAAYQIKSAISKVISSTRNKILLCDFDGVLRDLKELKADNPMVATEIRGIVQEALKALSTLKMT